MQEIHYQRGEAENMNWIVVADSDVSTLRDAGQILCRQKMRVTDRKSTRLNSSHAT